MSGLISGQELGFVKSRVRSYAGLATIEDVPLTGDRKAELLLPVPARNPDKVIAIKIQPRNTQGADQAPMQHTVFSKPF